MDRLTLADAPAPDAGAVRKLLALLAPAAEAAREASAA